MNKLVSIIVPVYNNDKYISYCIDSIIKQTYKKIEIIIVDDGSSDNTGTICDNYQKNYSFIKVIHKKNEGQSNARNLGLKYAHGEFIMFVDSDDLVNENYVEILLNNLIKTNSDLSVCKYAKIYNHDFINFRLSNNYYLLNKKQTYYEMIMNDYFAGYIWNKLYKMKIIKELSEPIFNDYVIEDFEFNSRYVNKCKKIVYTDNILYYYFLNSNGLTGSFKINDKLINGIKGYNNIIKIYDDNKILNSDYVAYNCLKYQLNINYRAYKLKYQINFRIIDSYLYKRVINSKIINMKDKIKIFLIYHFPIFCYEIKYRFKKGVI